jgi:hypothetical protein
MEISFIITYLNQYHIHIPLLYVCFPDLVDLDRSINLVSEPQTREVTNATSYQEKGQRKDSHVGKIDQHRHKSIHL